MKYTTEEFLDELKNGSLTWLDIENRIEELTKLNPDKLKALGRIILDDLSKDRCRLDFSSIDEMPKEFQEWDNLKSFVLDGKSEEPAFFYQLRNDLRTWPLRFIRNSLSKLTFNKMVTPNAVNDCFEVLKNFFPKDRHEDLLSLLSGKTKPSMPLTFDGNWKQLCVAFGIMEDEKLLNGFKNQSELASWLLENFDCSKSKNKSTPSTIIQNLGKKNNPKRSIILRIIQDSSTGVKSIRKA